MKRYLRFLWLFLAVDILGIFAGGFFYVKSTLPDTILISNGWDESFFSILNHPCITCSKMEPEAAEGTITLQCEYLGILPVQKIQVKLAKEQTVAVSGAAVGIYLQTSGVLVVDEQELAGMDGTVGQPWDHIVQPGDYIERLNGKEINSKEELVETVQTCEGNPIVVTAKRKGVQLEYQLKPFLCSDGSYRLGLWVRDDIQGVGTLTYVTENGTFGALGHGISDSKTEELLNIYGGKLYHAKIVDIKKGEKGTPGELYGFIKYTKDNQMGTIVNNQSNGIHGRLYGIPETIVYDEYLVGHKQEVEEGAATILCALDGTNLKEYEIRIVKINMNGKESNKSFVVEVEDRELIESTGGIVQGMSGSPIIQNGKFVGAVTHVFVNDPTKGYGIFADTMLEQE